MIVCFMLAASCATVSMAQDGGNGGAERRGVRFTGGPVAEMNASGFVHSGISGGRSTMDIGANVGGFVDMEITRWFSIQGCMTFQYKSSDFEWTGETGDTSTGELRFRSTQCSICRYVAAAG